MDTEYLDNIDPMEIVILEISSSDGSDLIPKVSSIELNEPLYKIVKTAYFQITTNSQSQTKIYLHRKTLCNDEIKYLYFRLIDFSPSRSGGMSVAEP